MVVVAPCRCELPCRSCRERVEASCWPEPDMGDYHPLDGLWDCSICDREVWVGIGPLPTVHARGHRRMKAVDDYDAALLEAARLGSG